MRGLMISIMIIIFCMSIEIVNSVEATHFAETGRPIFGWGTNTSMNYRDIEGVQNNDMEGVLTGFVSPKEQPQGLVADLLNTVVYIVKAGTFLVNVLWKSTIGFGSFIQNLGRADLHCVPSYIALPLMVLVNLNHAFVILQVMTGRSLKDGL